MFLLLLLTVYRAWVMASLALPLYVDEAYYWSWAQNLDWGYFSKPPAIAGLIAATTSVCGDSEFCVRAGALFLHPVTALLIFFIGRELFGSVVGFAAGLVYITMPAIALSSMVISTDVLLLMFWSFSLYFFIEALEHNHWALWVLFGLSVGLGLLSKYSMIVFPASALLYLSLSKQQRRYFLEPGLYIAALVAFAVFLPNILWNMNHDFITVAHHAHISNWSQAGLYFSELAEFVLGQFFVFGPVLFAALVVLLLSCYSKLRRFDSVLLLVSFTLPIMFLMLAQSLLGRANANWAAPAYIGGSLLVVAFLFGQRRFVLLGLALAINIALMGVMYHYYPILRGLDIELTAARDPYVRLKGWDEFGEQAIARRNFFPDSAWLAKDRDVLSALSYYTRQLKHAPVYAFNDNGVIDNQFELATNYLNAPNRRFIYVSDSELPDALALQFGKIEMLPPISFKVSTDKERNYLLYALSTEGAAQPDQ